MLTPRLRKGSGERPTTPRPSFPRATHTYAVLEVSEQAYREIRDKLLAAGYQHALHGSGQDEVIDMHGIALKDGPA